MPILEFCPNFVLIIQLSLSVKPSLGYKPSRDHPDRFVSIADAMQCIMIVVLLATTALSNCSPAPMSL